MTEGSPIADGWDDPTDETVTLVTRADADNDVVETAPPLGVGVLRWETVGVST